MKKTDNKQLKKLVEQQQHTIDQLQKQNELMNNQLERLNAKLQESEAFKSHFISNVTNEIINPFASVMGLSKSILQMKGGDMKKASSLAAMIFSEAAFLDFQLTNIFAAAKLEAGEIAVEVSSTNIMELLNDAVKKLQYGLDKKKLILNIEEGLNESSEKPIYFKTDSEKLQLIVVNLLSNAIRASGEGKEITLKVQLKSDNLLIEVADRGTGMSEEEQEKIFDRFRRIDTTINSLNPGNGLGLSVVKGLLDILGGEINIDSSIRKGTKVTITLPEATGAETIFDDDLFSDVDDESF